MAKKSAVTAIRHKDKRTNIPTHELADFVAEDEKSPKSALYPRDSSLDPQLVWKGKDEQDRMDLEVPTVPIYIQEKIHAQAIMEGLRGQNSADPQLELFGDFNGIEFEQLVDFYQHEQNWSNRMILGDSLLVMNSLAEKEGLRGRVQTIYFDPPYGIKFGSNWQVSTRKRDVKDKKEDVTAQPEQVKAFRDTWELGIHSYLAYLRDRLTAARELLTPSGSIFVQIGDDNVHLVRNVLDEVFGSQNHVVSIVVKKKGSQKSSLIDPVNDHIIWYSKSSRQEQNGTLVKFRKLLQKRELDATTLQEFRLVQLPDGTTFPVSSAPGKDGPIDYRLRPEQLFADYPGARLYRAWPITNGGERKNQSLPFTFDGTVYNPPPGRCWSHTARADDGLPSGMERVNWAGRLMASGRALDFKRFLDDGNYKMLSNWWDGLGGAPDQVYVVQTNPEIIKRCILMTTDPGDLVLDPTCGSGTTACVAEQWGRRWIVIDTSRVALALARTRLMTMTYPYYLLLDSPAGAQKEAELTGQLPTSVVGQQNDVKKGFVLKRSRRVTSASIANNVAVDEVRGLFQPKLDAFLAKLNKAGGTNWKEWDVPRQAETGLPKAVAQLFQEWWKLKRDCQAKMDLAVDQGAETELLYDQPYEESKRVRVTGPFTVESLSPHRLLAADEEMPKSEIEGKSTGSAWSFNEMILDNLRKAGVQNTRRAERLKFEELETFPGGNIHAVGAYKDATGVTKRVAISIGPENGTVGRDQIKEAAKEALKGTGYDLLITCAFAFDGTASQAAREFAPQGEGDGFSVEETQIGKLRVLLARINPDLAMGDSVLKKTGSGNLFMVFGEPDIKIHTRADGQLQASIAGLDIYDPTTGEVRNSKGVDDIACWFIDTNYNQESFFVRHAYFTGAGEPLEKLKKALRSEINEGAWAALNTNQSRPFPRPKSGKIAIKVINDYGDEVLKVYSV
jgi:adenine-specific DNA-methyltransferase